MKRIVLVTLGTLIALTLIVPRILEAMKSDEDLIRELVAEAIEAFEEGSVSGVVAPLAKDFRLAGRSMGRAEIRDLMLFLSREARDEGGFTLRVARIPGSDLVTIDGDRAGFELDLVLRRRERDGDAELWEFHLTLELGRGDEGWAIERATIETLSGRPRY